MVTELLIKVILQSCPSTKLRSNVLFANVLSRKILVPQPFAEEELIKMPAVLLLDIFSRVKLLKLVRLINEYATLLLNNAFFSNMLLFPLTTNPVWLPVMLFSEKKLLPEKIITAVASGVVILFFETLLYELARLSAPGRPGMPIER